MFSPGVKRPKPENNHSLSSSADVKNIWTLTSVLPRVFMAQ
jgi:hypothetical protein